MHEKNPDWVVCGKTIRSLISDLSTFENQELEVRISLDGGMSSKPVSIVKKSGLFCVIANSEIDE